MSIRDASPNSPLFVTKAGLSLTHSMLTKAIRAFLEQAGYPPRPYTPHSLRAGSATDAAQSGAPDSAVQRLGRWQSSAFTAYLRPSQLQEALVAGRLAAGQGPPP